MLNTITEAGIAQNPVYYEGRLHAIATKSGAVIVNGAISYEGMKNAKEIAKVINEIQSTNWDAVSERLS